MIVNNDNLDANVYFIIDYENFIDFIKGMHDEDCMVHYHYYVNYFIAIVVIIAILAVSMVYLNYYDVH